jgi:hypothetical protein
VSLVFPTLKVKDCFINPSILIQTSSLPRKSLPKSRITPFRKLRQQEHEFKGSLRYIVSLRLA